MMDSFILSSFFVRRLPNIIVYHTFLFFATGFRNFFAVLEKKSAFLLFDWPFSSLFGKKYHIKKGKFGTFDFEEALAKSADLWYHYGIPIISNFCHIEGGYRSTWNFTTLAYS